jgi:hypothetical protein
MGHPGAEGATRWVCQRCTIYLCQATLPLHRSLEPLDPPPAAHEHLGVALFGSSDHADADETALSSPSPSPPDAGGSSSDMDISPPSPATPPALQAPTLLAGLPSPVARRNLHPYLAAFGLPRSAVDPTSGYSLSRAVALAEGDTSVLPALIQKLRAIIDETKVGGGRCCRFADCHNATASGGPPLPVSTARRSPTCGAMPLLARRTSSRSGPQGRP